MASSLKYKAKEPYIQYQAYGPELIPVSRQPVFSWHSLYPPVECHYFPPGPQFFLPATEHHCPLAGTKLYC